MFLQEHFGISFNDLFAITNLPIGRTKFSLERQKLYRPYLQFLESHFNSTTIEHLMCRDELSIDYLGNVYDCDFNQMLDLPLISSDKPKPHLRDLLTLDLTAAPIAIGEHCYGCTAGQGSSCGGALN